MLKDRLHADHIDETGIYARKLEVIQEMLATGTLKELPPEFTQPEPVGEVVASTTPIESTAQVVSGGQQEYALESGHADHVDETGRYRQEWEQKFGRITEEVPVSGQSSTQSGAPDQSWKSFLSKIIDEERSKLNI